jgi:signal transduction histidine kinase
MNLADFMEQHREELLQHSVLVMQRRAPGHDERELTGTLPAYLDELIWSLRQGEFPQERRESPEGQHAARMGSQRQARGFDIASVAHLFGSISESLGEMGRRANASFSASDYQAFNRCIDASIARAIESFHASAQRSVETDAAEFVGFLAHELRNELWTARMAHSWLLRDDEAFGSRTREALGRSLRRMEGLIAQTLAAVQLESGKAAELRPLAVHEMLDELQAAAFPERQISLRMEVERPLEVQGDERLLGSALANLIQNALKFTRSGGQVVVRARRTGGQLVVEVEDECGGLPPGKREELFSPFVQHGENRSGLGLGLTITKRAVAAHGGEIDVRDLPGKGCVFTIRVPLDPAVQV